MPSPKRSITSSETDTPLFLLVMPNGARCWRFRYRFLDKQKVIALGVWPEVSLADARVKHHSAGGMIDDGVDPMVEKKRSLPAPWIFRS